MNGFFHVSYAFLRPVSMVSQFLGFSFECFPYRSPFVEIPGGHQPKFVEPCLQRMGGSPTVQLLPYPRELQPDLVQRREQRVARLSGSQHLMVIFHQNACIGRLKLYYHRSQLSARHMIHRLRYRLRWLALPGGLSMRS